ncbi:NnrS family protein [Halospina sp. K52047b]|uniref:NnrS family protein n=1 Tax=Halospina sp. K52047b TaxID=2614160 RepID=UPI00124A00DC|nr:NnrS family protein [Halospina sp. K52047b]KAA8977801.1 NnrS family protein [Halospina sp. K52047b]
MRTLLAYGFRPFFLLAAAYAPLSLIPWLLMLWRFGSSDGGLNPALWHGHEMLFGVVGAGLAGFLLTALPSWTDREPIAGRRLLMLVGLWLVSRLTLWFDASLPDWMIGVGACLFLLILCLEAIPYFMAPAGRRHWSLATLLLLVCASQVAFHVVRAAGNGAVMEPATLLDLALHLYIIMIAVTLTRITAVVIPSALERSGYSAMIRLSPARIRVAIGMLCLYTGVAFVLPSHPVTGWVALAAATSQLDRLSEWPWGRPMGQPFLLLVVLAYLWIVLGLVFNGIGLLLEGVPAGLGRHAFAIGAVGTALMSVFCIAGLRHTGRLLDVPWPIWISMTALSVSALLRVLVPLLWPGLFLPLGVGTAFLLWASAFAVYLICYTPMLVRPRVDGLPG